MTNEFTGSIHFSSEALMFSGEHEAYYREIKGKIRTIKENDKQQAVGTIGGVLVLTDDAVTDEMDLMHICDAHSAGLLEAYFAIFEEQAIDRDELEIEPGWRNFLYINELDIQPIFRKTNAAEQAIEALAESFCALGIVAADDDLIPIEKWLTLGFEQVEDKEIVFRSNLEDREFLRQWQPEDIRCQLRAAIQNDGRSFYAIAKEAGIAPIQISRFANGERSINLSTAAKICRVLRLKLQR